MSLFRKSKRTDSASKYADVADGLKTIYKNTVLPAEKGCSTANAF